MLTPLTWTNERKPLHTLTPWDLNPRKITAAQLESLRDSLDRFNLADPIIIDADGTIIGGRQRVEALCQLHSPTILVDVRVPNRKLTDDEFRELNIRLNRHNGEWDWARLEELFDADALQSLGFTIVELEDNTQLLDEPISEIIDVEPRIEEGDQLREKWAVELGQIWQLGRHRIMCGSAVCAADVAALLADSKPHLMVTDPPYGVNYEPAWRVESGLNKSGRLGKVSNDDKADWREAWALFTGSVAYVWHAGLFASTVEDSLRSCGFEMRSQIIWSKNRFALSRGDYHWQHEPCWYAVRKGQNGHYNGARDQSTVWEISSGNQDADTIHGTQKPIECMERPMRNSSRPGEYVYDPFLGSGTSVIAAERSSRRCLGMELDPVYVAVAIQRWADVTGEEPFIIETREHV
jgi:DNA modification methylase